MPEWSERKPSQHLFHKLTFLKDMDDFTFATPDDLLENFLNEEYEYPREEMDAETLTMFTALL